MRRRGWIPLSILIGLLLVALVSVITSAHQPLRVYAYTSDIGSPAKQSYFSVNDSGMDLRIGLNDSVDSRHSVSAIWYTPQHHWYDGFTGAINRTGEILVWTNRINGTDMAQLPGNWEINVSLDGDPVESLVFGVYDNRPLNQPVSYWTWPSYTIKVVIPNDPAYARNDVILALEQWNTSQVWFQKEFNLSQRPTYSLVVSNDTSSPAIIVSFNATQSNKADLGFGGTFYPTLRNGTVVGLICKESLDLHYLNGQTVNNITLRNLALHETGHCLGLSHVVRNGDMMNHFSASSFDYRSPSTLNLFALYEEYLYGGRFVPPDTVYVLPQSISYEASPLEGVS